MTEVPPVRRRLAGAALRRFREQAGYSPGEAARILACDRSKISRIETGQRGIRPAELQELLARYGVDEPRREALLSVARQTRQAGWWQSCRAAGDDACHGLIGLDAAGAAIRAYDAQFVPGLLQTSDYARAMAAASLAHQSREERERFVQGRLAQQQALTRADDPLPFWAILSEAALRQMTGGREVMRAQLGHLIEVSDGLPNVSLHVLPFAAGAHAAASGPFVLLTFPGAADCGVVYLQGQTGGIYLQGSEEVGRYALAFEHLLASALSAVATVRLIEEVTAGM